MRKRGVTVLVILKPPWHLQTVGSPQGGNFKHIRGYLRLSAAVSGKK
jgi:hypothetical protein